MASRASESQLLFGCPGDSMELERAKSSVWSYVSTANHLQTVGLQVLMTLISVGVTNPTDIRENFEFPSALS